MWYVMQVQTGKEKETEVQCGKLIDGDVLERCFIPYYEEMKHYLGSWHKERRILFPGYVFLISDKINELFIQLKKVIGMTRILEVGHDIVPLSDEEVDFLLSFGTQEQVVKISKGILEHDTITILEGPLQGREGSIKRINRHKRKAWVEIGMFGRKMVVEVGLEIVVKR
ncbi:MAG: antiterminator LoaP [Clostridium sp.]